MAKFKVVVTYEMCGIMEVEAESLEDAIDKVENDEEYDYLPSDADYIDGSFNVDVDASKCQLEFDTQGYLDGF